MDIVTASVESQQVREPVLAAHVGWGWLSPGRAMAVARRGRARRDKEMARANILNDL
jgi:hypothetical protein